MFVYAKPEQKQVSKRTMQRKKMDNSVSSPNLTGIPNATKTQFENLSGFSFDDVQVHYNSDKPARLQALAYTQGNQVYIAPGQENHLGHELGHVVQQKMGRVKANTHFKGITINDNEKLEREVDTFAQMKSADGKVTQNVEMSSTVIQRYFLTVGTSAELQERQYVYNVPANEGIQFTGFSSCVGIVVKNIDGTLSGVHLSIMGSGVDNDTIANEPNIVTAICNALGNYDRIVMFGCFGGYWANEGANVLTSITEVDIEYGPMGDGTYRVKFDNDNLKFSINGELI